VTKEKRAAGPVNDPVFSTIIPPTSRTASASCSGVSRLDVSSILVRMHKPSPSSEPTDFQGEVSREVESLSRNGWIGIKMPDYQLLEAGISCAFHFWRHLESKFGKKNIKKYKKYTKSGGRKSPGVSATKFPVGTVKKGLAC
jgi:hypothetical protein